MARPPKRSRTSSPRTSRPPGTGGGRSGARTESRERPGWSLQDDSVETALVSGEFARELEEVFGPEEYAELRALAREAHRRGRRGGRRVLILPGIMGSKLGEPRKFLGLFPTDDVYWIDPFDLVLGNLAKLAFRGGPGRIKPVGVMLIAYLRLKLRLRADGFDADFHAYDWRRSIADLGADLKRDLDKHPGTSLVAHSMGGLVSRAAIKQGAKIERLIQLGSPNFGSYAPLLALRGADDSVKKIAALDFAHDQTQMINGIFRGFPGLLELLPSLPNDPGAVFFDRAQWPTDAKKKASERLVAPDAPLLRACGSVQDMLEPYDPAKHRWALIAGVNQDTVVGATYVAEKDEVVFTTTPEGDGTVPLRFARVPKMPTYYVEESHGQLANHATVAHAVADLLDRGETNVLPTTPPPIRRAPPRKISESELRAIDPYPDVAPAMRGGEPQGVRQNLRSADLRRVLAGFAGPGADRPGDGRVAAAASSEAPASTSAGSPTPVAASARLNRVVVARARQHRLDIQIANCSITQISSRAYVLGLFREVAPSGAAGAIDRLLSGAVSEFTRRRMYSGGVGEVFILPANRSRLRADLVLFAGLGYFDQFNDEVQKTTAEHVIRTFVRTRVEDCATVLVGGGTGTPVPQLLANLLEGFVRGKLDADEDHHFRRVTLCETDPKRYAQIREELYRLASTPLFEEVEATFTELTDFPPDDAAPGAPDRSGPGDRGPREPDPVYLIVRREREEEVVRSNGTRAKTTEKRAVFTSSVLTSGSKAAVLTDTQSVAIAKLESELDRTTKSSFGVESAQALGQFVAENVLAESVREALPRMKGKHLVVVHDGPSSRIPWETLRLGAWEPALDGGMSRRYMAENLSVAKYLDQRARGAKLRVLLVVNPTEDLPGAQKEGQRVRGFFEKRPDVELRILERKAATRRALLDELASGRHDLVHYAGHAFFDADVRARSGLLCAGEDVLSGTDIGALGNLPQLVFFNACESGRTRERSTLPGKKAVQPAKEKGERVAPAEAFLRGGIANFIGTYWPVGDDAADVFSSSFYTRLLEGASVGAAIKAARAAVRETNSVDWSDYIHYGDSATVVFPNASPTREREVTAAPEPSETKPAEAETRGRSKKPVIERRRRA